MKSIIKNFAVAAAIAFSTGSLLATPTLIIQAPTPGAPPSSSGDGQIQTWLIGAVGDYNTAHGTTYSTAGIGAVPNIKVNTGNASPGAGYPSFGNNTLSITLAVGAYDYVVFHWGGEQGNSYQAFWLGGEADNATYTFNAPGQNGLSFYSFYQGNGSHDEHNMPEGGATVALLGMALCGLAFFRSRLVKA